MLCKEERWGTQPVSIADAGPAIVDLKDVTYIDGSGEELLSEMQTAGAAFVAGTAAS